jgi:uncharacterized protein with PQ loop repeat
VIDAIGYLASLGALLMWFPQGWRAVRHRHAPETLAGISVAAYGTGFVFNALLLVYGIGTHGVPVVAAACVNIVMSSFITTVVLRARSRS